MSVGTTNISPQLRSYIAQLYFKKNTVIQSLLRYNKTLELSSWPASEQVGSLLYFLTKITNAKKTLEIGVFTGYSTLLTALALPKEGKIIACDIDKRMYTVADFFWKKAGIRHKIDFKLAPAKKTLMRLVKKEKGTFDMVFIDADKENYNIYYEYALALIKQNGIIVIDNMFWGGSIINQKTNDPATVHMRKFNKKIASDKRVECSTLMIADGVTLVRKK